MRKGPEPHRFSAFFFREEIFSNRVTGSLADESAPINSLRHFQHNGKSIFNTLSDRLVTNDPAFLLTGSISNR